MKLGNVLKFFSDVKPKNKGSISLALWTCCNYFKVIIDLEEG